MTAKPSYKILFFTLLALWISFFHFGQGSLGVYGATVQENESILEEINLEAHPPIEAEPSQDYSQLPHYIPQRLERYQDYQRKNPELSLETVVTWVNIGLDLPYYTEVQPIESPGDLGVLVNKYHQLPEGYVPSKLERISGTNFYLRHEARVAFEAMGAEAKRHGLNIYPVSTYRSYAYQKNLYQRYLNKYPQQEVDQFSARAGHSEHQLGLAVDVLGTEAWVAYTPEYRWYMENAHRFGFILRYPPNKEAVTGYQYEPWHLRYLGVDLATAVKESGLTYDEYYIRYLNQ